MTQQFISLWQDTFVAGYPVGVLVMIFEISGALAFGLYKYMATRPVVYRDGLILVPTWTGSITMSLMIYHSTSMWPGLLTIGLMGATCFAGWAWLRNKQLSIRQ
ncbi:hypothetical protein [Fibrisoma limi]|nr:hypothetical protein [Fibrisoma limi]